MSNMLDVNELELTESDAQEMKQFLRKQEQISKLNGLTHTLTEMCWKKCITSNVKNNSLDKSEATCMANCVQRFFDVNTTVQTHLSRMQQAMAAKQ